MQLLPIILATAAAQPFFDTNTRGPLGKNASWPRKKEVNASWPRKDFNGTLGNASCVDIFEALKERRPGGKGGKDGKGPGRKGDERAARKPSGEGEGPQRGPEKDASAENATRKGPAEDKFLGEKELGNETAFAKEDVERCFAAFGEKKREKEETVMKKEKELEVELYGVDADACLRYFEELKDGAGEDAAEDDPDLNSCFALFDEKAPDEAEGRRPGGGGGGGGPGGRAAPDDNKAPDGEALSICVFIRGVAWRCGARSRLRTSERGAI